MAMILGRRQELRAAGHRLEHSGRFGDILSVVAHAQSGATSGTRNATTPHKLVRIRPSHSQARPGDPRASRSVIRMSTSVAAPPNC